MYQKRTIVVVGGGLAGLSASIAASENRNARIILLEKAKSLGGNSAKATSGINAVFTEAQRHSSVLDSYDIFSRDTENSGKGLSDPELVDVLVSQSTNAVAFLESFGVDLSSLIQCGGHSAPRTHRCNPDNVRNNVGREIVVRLSEGLHHLPNIEVHLLTDVVDVQPFGVKYAVTTENVETGLEKNFVADRLIFASGGFGADVDGLLKKYSPDLASFPTTNGPTSMGDGIKYLKNLGADVVDLTEIQVHPTGFLNQNDPQSGKVFLAPEAIRGSGALLVNQEGKRFVNELDLRDEVVTKIDENCVDEFRVGRKIAYLLLNEETEVRFGKSPLGFYKHKGLMFEYSSFKDLIESHPSINYDVIKKTIMDYSVSYEKAQADKTYRDQYGKSIFLSDFKLTNPVTLAYVTPSIHYTMGGVKIDAKGRVVKSDGSTLRFVYAAGEVTGGVHGRNRLAGNSLLECVVFGRIAGKNAALRF